MEALDTNILIRLATRDDKRQFARANDFVHTRFFSSSPAWISIIVLVEYVWVLGSLHGNSRSISATRTLDRKAAKFEG